MTEDVIVALDCAENVTVDAQRTSLIVGGQVDGGLVVLRRSW